MASKSNIVVVIDNGSGINLKIQDDATGYLVVTMSDGVKPLAMKLSQADSAVLSRAVNLSNSLRQTLPQS